MHLGGRLDKPTSLLVPAGSTPDDNLTTRRLAFLGAALASIPIIGGGRELFGQHVDGLLLAVGGVLLAVGGAVIVPLVMARVGRLSAQRARAERALLYQATHDALTGLSNRREFVARLTEELSRDHQRIRPLVLFCDLDGFKAVNDRLGHAATAGSIRLSRSPTLVESVADPRDYPAMCNSETERSIQASCAVADRGAP
ncbi:MAG: hypothetical protein JWP76_2509 [Dactylosporangium sp.]|jgi:hypothetical protein|nr:hypothetical protein [Dactylosporangium sp.]